MTMETLEAAACFLRVARTNAIGRKSMTLRCLWSPLMAGFVVCSLVMGAVSPAIAEEQTDPDVPLLDEILLDAAPVVAGDRTGNTAAVDGVTAVVPEESSAPMTLQADGGPEVAVSLPEAEQVEAADAEGAAASFDFSDGSRIVPVIRNNGVAQILSVLNEETAPTSFSYRVTVDAGGSLTMREDGGVSVLDSVGEEVAMVGSPWARDAENRAIPTRFEIRGNELTQIVETVAVDEVAYPVVADPAVSVKMTKYKITDLVKTNNWTNKSKQLGVCKIQAGGGGGRCTISASYKVESSVSAAFGATSAWVSAQIGMNASYSVSGRVSWTSGIAPARTTFKAWTVGTRAAYKVQKWAGYKTLGMSTPNWKLVGTSATLSAFSPVRASL
ncbi:hypothetical protein CSX12_03020 [Microbacterium sp. Y-01]|uniref:hypothetical protein n=1 Tax=Microbacterium sp. Y-01 TaxID=2048898 RepID=UPI000F5E391A|nr:hypothetical protein [Microbacterium sp. Y-01]AZH77497.1 hypothetical protein CSX12_03020 [Microbacterium sp. Y-01]